MITPLPILIEQCSMYLPLVIGAFMSFSLLKVPNLCLESAFLMGGICSHLALSAASPLPILVRLFIGIIAGLAGGALVGLTCSLIITRGRIAYLLANIVTLGLFSGITLFLLGGPYVALEAKEAVLTLLPLQHHPELVSICFIAALCLLAILFLLRTPLGKSIMVYGNNPLFFDYHHISAPFVLTGGLTLSNALAGLSGFLTTQTNGFLDINGPNGIVLFCLAALILGKMRLRPTSPFVMVQPAMGLLILCIIQQLLVMLGIQLTYFTSISSLIILSIVLFARGKNGPLLPTDQLGV
ncbi:MAG: hypothetical protein M1549_03740 [Candidatus Dependentiae bacterium]|nr:hypothetical protein [Candidatus Dependentiae bacterium]